MKVWLPI